MIPAVKTEADSLTVNKRMKEYFVSDMILHKEGQIFFEAM